MVRKVPGHFGVCNLVKLGFMMYEDRNREEQVIAYFYKASRGAPGGTFLTRKNPKATHGEKGCRSLCGTWLGSVGVYDT